MGRKMGGRFRRQGIYMYTNGWFMLRFDRKEQNSVKQLTFNKKINLKKSPLKLPTYIYSQSFYRLGEVPFTHLTNIY